MEKQGEVTLDVWFWPVESAYTDQWNYTKNTYSYIHTK